MARGSNANRMRANNHPSINIINRENAAAAAAAPAASYVEADRNTLNDVDVHWHWNQMPKGAKKFLLDNARDSFMAGVNINPCVMGLHKLAKFWSCPSRIEYTRGVCVGIRAVESSWSIALNYLKLGRLAEARALTLNGSFLDQCFAGTPIEDILQLCGPHFSNTIKDHQLPVFSQGVYSLRCPQRMEAYLQTCLPHRKGHQDNIMSFVGQVGDDWSATSPGSSSRNSTTKASDGTQLQIILVDDSNEDETRHIFDIGSSTTLKTLFRDYAEKRGVSLRSLRFSYQGKTLFLSSVGSKTPDECNMRDQDLITVHDTTAEAQEPSSIDLHQTKKKLTPKKSKTSKKNCPKKSKCKGKKKQHKREGEPVQSLEECKARHSKILTKLHEEMGPRLKEIRMRLNSLDLERQPPKQKKKNKRKKEKKRTKESSDPQILPTSGIGGKAGKSRFEVQVGEVQNLYKTAKPSSVLLSSRKGPLCIPQTLDLHGCTKVEALVKLDDTLKVWVDTAMRGSYPFVIPATIICGCGTQILSETVQDWIKTTKNVCNAQKKSMSRNKF